MISSNTLLLLESMSGSIPVVLDSFTELSLETDSFSLSQKTLLEQSLLIAKSELAEVVNIRLNGERFISDQIDEWDPETIVVSEIKINVNKASLGWSFFLSEGAACNWLTESNPFDISHPLNSSTRHEPFKVFVSQINQPVISSAVAIGSPKALSSIILKNEIPIYANSLSIRGVNMSTSSLYFNGSLHLQKKSNVVTRVHLSYARFSFSHIMAEILDSVYSENELTISSSQEIVIPAFNPKGVNTSILANMSALLVEIKFWIQEENAYTRRSVLLDHLAYNNTTLKQDLFNPFELRKHFNISKEKYRTVLRENTKAYLSDINTVSSHIVKSSAAISGRIKSLFSSILRDFLAVFSFIALTVFSRITVVDSEIQLKLLSYGLALYCFFSFVTQVVLFFIERSSSTKELKATLSKLRQELSRAEIETQVDNLIGSKITIMTIIILLVGVLYFIIIYSALNYKEILTIIS